MRSVTRTLSTALLSSGLIIASAPPLTHANGNSEPAPPDTPKKLSSTVRKGLDWLLTQQLPSGGWGQGEESVQMGRGMAAMKRKANVADTAMATLALLRSGSTPQGGKYAKPIRRAVDFVLSGIEAADDKSLYVTSVRGTRVQGKIGPYIDTFVSAQLLAELKGQMPDEKSEVRLLSGLDKVMAKIRKHQRADGSFAGGAWAPVLSQAVAGKAIQRAAKAGAEVPEEVRERAEKFAKRQYDAKKDSFDSAGSAGVGLYSAAAGVSTLGDSVSVNELGEQKARDEAANAEDETVRKQAQEKLARYAETRQTANAAEDGLMRRLEDPRFAAGFGSNGGEEFLSYMLVSETLRAKGGKQWKRWDQLMAANLGRVQNGDGSWTGHHCITGRTFCTAAALLVLTADRAPAAIAQQIRRG